MIYSPIVRFKKDEWFFQMRFPPFCESLTAGGQSSDVLIPDCGTEKIILICNGAEESVKVTAVGATLEDGKKELQFSAAARSHVYVNNPSGSRAFSVLIIPAFTPDVPTYDREVSLPRGTAVTVGNSREAEIMTRLQGMQDVLFRLTTGSEGYRLEPAGYVPGGLWLNTEKIVQPVDASEGDFITCAGFHGCLLHGRLLLPSAEGTEIHNLRYVDDAEQKSHLNYPLINRMSRQLLKNSTEGIEILDPPAKPEQAKSRLFLSLLPSAAMILLTVTLRSSFASNSSMIVFSALSMGIGGVTTVINYITGKKDYNQKIEQREKVYKKYIRDREQEIVKARGQEQEILRRMYISPKQEMQNIEDFSAELFDRSMSDQDFLHFRLGFGKALSSRQVTHKKHETFEGQDELFRIPKDLSEKYRCVEDVPVIIQARTANAIGLIGCTDSLTAVLRNLVLDLCSRQYFQDVQAYAFLSESFQREKNACRMMPHFKNNRLGRRNIAHDDESFSILSEDLYKQLSERETAGGKLPEDCPWIVVLADDEHVMQHPLMRYVEKASQLHCVFLFFLQNRELLPQGCSDIIMLFNNRAGGVIIPLNHSGVKQLFDYEQTPVTDLRKASERLAPVYSGQLSLAANLSSNVSLYQIMGLDKPSADGVAEVWKRADTASSLAAPLGLMENQSVLMLDLHEKKHGPHGLVAGTTGSGKSQVLISYVLALAANYSPEDVNFAVIDFKGGDIVKHLPGLPHIVGSITNLNKRDIERSRRAINAEKMRRMILFDDPAVKVGNISEYTRAYRKGIAKTPLPHLIIIVDEFAELKQQYPDFMKDLISLSRVGRSLGIHLILCTQKPAGVVDPQIWGNSDFKLCLRVQSGEDSNEVIKSPLAAEIREPGRGYLQVGRTEQFDLFQSGYSGTPEAGLKDTPYQVLERSLSGKNRVLYQHKVKREDDSNRTQREALLEAVLTAWDRSGMQKPFPLCLPPIPDQLPYEEPVSESEYSIPVGLFDAPDEQAIKTLSIDLTEGNVLIMGASQMGKTNLLQVLLRRLASGFTTDEARVYAMDFNANAIKNMESLSIVSGVVTADEEEKLKNLFRLLKEEITIRKQRLMEARVTTFASYRAVYTDLPQLVVMIDNLAVFKELYTEQYGGDLSFLFREGPALGITFVVTIQQMNALGYRDTVMFTQKIALTLNEMGEYSAFFGSCRTEPKNVPGRVLVQRDKQFFEGQIYEAFSVESDGEDEELVKNEAYARELEKKRSELIDRFLKEHSTAPKAGRIPEVPKVLTTELLHDLCGKAAETMFPVGMEYRDVKPVWLDLNRQFIMAVIGKNMQAVSLLTNRFLYVSAALAQQKKALLFLIDGYDRPYQAWANIPGITKYTNIPEEVEELLKKTDEFMENRVTQMRENPEMEIYPLIFVIHSEDMAMTFTNGASDLFKKIADKYRRAGLMFFFSGVENKTIGYSSPDVLKYIRDQRQAILLNELGSIKAFDGFSLAIQRANSRPLEDGEAFVLNGDEISRVRLVTDSPDALKKQNKEGE